MQKAHNNKVVIITGASSGIGEAVAYELARSHFSLVLAARRESRLRKVAKKAAPRAAGVLVVDTDVSNYGEIKRLVRRTITRFGRIDVLLNIAGWGSYGWFEEQKPRYIKEQYEVNVLGAAYAIHEVLPIMMEQRSGHIINMVSYASRIATPPMTVYASTKYALEGLTDGLRRELLAWGIKVSRVHPSGVGGTEYNRKASRRGGVKFKSPKIGHISKEYVAQRISELIRHPRPELMLGRWYDVPAFINRYLPGLVDFALRLYVARQRGQDLLKK